MLLLAPYCSWIAAKNRDGAELSPWPLAARVCWPRHCLQMAEQRRPAIPMHMRTGLTTLSPLERGDWNGGTHQLEAEFVREAGKVLGDCSNRAYRNRPYSSSTASATLPIPSSQQDEGWPVWVRDAAARIDQQHGEVEPP